jgi:hypothetical protein
MTAMSCIDQFLTRYRKEYDFYDQAGRLVANLLEQNIQRGNSCNSNL